MFVFLGHELTGEIVEVNETSNPKRLKVGMKIAASFIAPCGNCSPCSSGNDNLCHTFGNNIRSKGVLFDGTTRLSFPNGEKVYRFK